MIREIDYTAVQQRGADTVVEGVRHFDLAQTLDCGQAFRWAAMGQGVFCGFAHGRRLELELTDHTLTLKNVTLAEFEMVWENYFDLNRDYGKLRDMFNQHETMKKALAFSPGLRLLAQDKWEMLVSFILSQNSNIPRIKKMIETLCQNFGQVLPCGGYAFPTAEKLAVLNESDLAVVRSGYRAAYIIDAAQQVASGKLNLHDVDSLPTEQLREALLAVHGVGPKVADCVLLFGFGRLECFPLDVWMKRVMQTLYPSGFPQALQQFAGIAQQFLFHYARSTPGFGE